LPRSEISARADVAGGPGLDAALKARRLAMSAFWTIVTFVFAFGVLGLVGWALGHVITVARRNSERLPH
jgi:hypothetical protein